jgi:hypothetical protein
MLRILRALFTFLAVTSAALVTLPAAADEASIPGHLVLAKPGGDAIVIWDATPVIITIVNEKMTDEQANALLEHDAIRNLARLAGALAPDARTVTVRVTYNKIGAVNPAYGAQTFAGVERYALLTAAASSVRGDKDKWMELGDKATPPAWLQFSITGRLPPRS